MEDYLATARRQSAGLVLLLPELSWRTYADRVRKFSALYRKQLDDHVTVTVRQWKAKVGSLAESDWLAFAVKLFDIHTRQMAPRNDSRHQSVTDSDWDLELARFLELLDVDRVLTWNATVNHR